MIEPVTIGRATLYLGDAREILPTLQGRYCVLTDPPYGIGKDGQVRTTGGNGGRKAYAFKGWDAERPAKVIFDRLRALSDDVIIWGGNYFADVLPATGKWLVWDKGRRINQSDGELAWTSYSGALRIKVMNRVELMTDGAEHPTQKPVRLMDWCIEQFRDPHLPVLDPFMGSGSSGVSAVKHGRAFVGIERDPDYFRIACRRIEEAQKQADLFIPQPDTPKPVQQSLLGDPA